MQIKTILRFHLVLGRIINMKKMTINSGENLGVKVTLFNADGILFRMVQPPWKFL